LNKYSHSCEEELIGEALKFVDAAFPNGMLVEFGGSTGKDNSNLFVFGEQGRELVLIESNPTRLKKTSPRNYSSFHHKRNLQKLVSLRLPLGQPK
jgi:hypothetical protein